MLEVRVFARTRVRWKVVEELRGKIRQKRDNRWQHLHYRLFLIIDLDQLRLIVTTPFFFAFCFLLELRMERTLLLNLVLMAFLRLSKNGDRLQLSHTEMTIHRHTGGAEEYERCQEYVK